MLAIAMSQVFLGVAAYMSRIATADAPQPMVMMVAFTVAHVAAGALTMAAGAVLAALVFRHVGPAFLPASPLSSGLPSAAGLPAPRTTS